MDETKSKIYKKIKILIILFLIISTLSILFLFKACKILSELGLATDILEVQNFNYNTVKFAEVPTNNTRKIKMQTVSYSTDSIKLIDDVIYTEKDLPDGISGKFKTYMDYRKITNKNSKQWKLQQIATTDEQGFRRYDDLYMISLGTYYSPEAGIEFEIEFDSGKIIQCITGDVKNDKHTDETNRYVEHNENIVEFIVDIKEINNLSKIMGDMSYSDMDGEITRIEKIERKGNIN